MIPVALFLCVHWVFLWEQELGDIVRRKWRQILFWVPDQSRTYISFFEPVLKNGEDILYLCFSSGVSSTYTSAQIAAQEFCSCFLRG